MSALLVGYARCSTDQQDLTAQRDGLLASGRRHTRGDQARPPGPVLARRPAIADELTTRRISLSLGGSVYDPTDAVGRLLFNVLAMVTEFESDLIRLRTVEGRKVAKAKGDYEASSPN